jgi:hypothetical protein
VLLSHYRHVGLLVQCRRAAALRPCAGVVVCVDLHDARLCVFISAVRHRRVAIVRVFLCGVHLVFVQ